MAMNPMMARAGGGGGMGSNMDLRIVMVIMVLVMALGFALAGDQGVFAGAPSNSFQSVLCLVTVFTYTIFEDRALAFVMSAMIFLMTVGSVILVGFYIINLHVIEPMMIKKKLNDIKREKAILNKMDDGTI
jgi:hypothetical protein